MGKDRYDASTSGVFFERKQPMVVKDLFDKAEGGAERYGGWFDRTGDDEPGLAGRHVLAASPTRRAS